MKCQLCGKECGPRKKWCNDCRPLRRKVLNRVCISCGASLIGSGPRKWCEFCKTDDDLKIGDWALSKPELRQIIYSAVGL